MCTICSYTWMCRSTNYCRVRHLALQEFVDLHIHVYEQIVYIGIYKANEDATTLAFLNRLEALDAFAEKHLDLATKAAAP